VERYIVGLSKCLTRMEHRVKIATFKGSTVGTLACTKEPPGSCSLQRILFESFDVIHTHGFRSPFSSGLGIFRSMTRDNVVMTVHTIFPERGIIDSVLKRAYDITLGDLALGNSRRFFCSKW